MILVQAADMDTNQVQIIQVDPEIDGQRLDNFLLRYLKGLPRTRVYRIVRKGEVRINGRRAKPQVRLKAGDKVRIPPIRDLERRPEAVGSFENLDSLVLHEDDHLIILNKPAGMAVHGGSGVNAGVIETLRHARTDLARCELVHRLDRGTSGCLMIAKRRGYLKLLQDALRRPGTLSKTYLAVVHGYWSYGQVTVDEPLATTSRSGQERFTRVDPAGKPARTLFRPLRQAEALSLVEAQPLTGRTHQIRVHSRWLRHAIIGDDRYGDEFADQQLRGRPRRMLLHATRLVIPPLEGHDRLEVTAPVDSVFKRFLETTLETNDLGI